MTKKTPEEIREQRQKTINALNEWRREYEGDKKKPPSNRTPKRGPKKKREKNFPKESDSSNDNCS